MPYQTTGTTGFNLDLNSIVEEAFERCGSELRTGYDLRTARRSLNLLLLDWANRGVNMWTIDSGSIPLVPGTATYDLPNDTVDLLEHVIRTGGGEDACGQNQQIDLTITRISVSTYATIPNKLVQGRPIQIWIERRSGATSPDASVVYPRFTVWPVPDNSIPYTLVYWRLRRMQDVGDGVNGQDIPFRFLPCMVSGLAYMLSMKIPGADARTMALKAMYDEDWQRAADEDREKAAIRLVPRSGFIGIR